MGCCKFAVEWHLCSRQIYRSHLPDLARPVQSGVVRPGPMVELTQATLLRRSGVMRRMSRAYHVSREEGRSLSDGEERPDASMYLQQFMSVLGNVKSAARPTLQHPTVAAQERKLANYSPPLALVERPWLRDKARRLFRIPNREIREAGGFGRVSRVAQAGVSPAIRWMKQPECGEPSPRVGSP